MPKRINDEFSELGWSAQRRYRTRKRKAGLCVQRGCWELSNGHVYCPKHAAIANAYAYRSAKKRLLEVSGANGKEVA